MTWRTYTPDGRTLEVEYAGGTWRASCDTGRGVGETAAEAIMRSLGEAITSIGPSSRTLKDWVAQQAAQLERERDD
jgi:hypothetical protein